MIQPGLLQRLLKLPERIETRLAERWDNSWNRSLLDLRNQAGITVEKMIGVYMGSRSYKFDALQVMPVGRFINALHREEIFWAGMDDHHGDVRQFPPSQ